MEARKKELLAQKSALTKENAEKKLSLDVLEGQLEDFITVSLAFQLPLSEYLIEEGGSWRKGFRGRWSCFDFGAVCILSVGRVFWQLGRFSFAVSLLLCESSISLQPVSLISIMLGNSQIC